MCLGFKPRAACDKRWKAQSTLFYFVRGSITVWLTSLLTGLDLTKQ